MRLLASQLHSQGNNLPVSCNYQVPHSCWLTCLVVFWCQRLTEAPHDMRDVSDDVLQRWQQTLELSLHASSVIHISCPGPTLLTLQHNTNC